jgi:hypothetical protein
MAHFEVVLNLGSLSLNFHGHLSCIMLLGYPNHLRFSTASFSLRHQASGTIS